MYYFLHYFGHVLPLVRYCVFILLLFVLECVSSRQNEISVGVLTVMLQLLPLTTTKLGVFYLKYNANMSSTLTVAPWIWTKFFLKTTHVCVTCFRDVGNDGKRIASMMARWALFSVALLSVLLSDHPACTELVLLQLCPYTQYTLVYDGVLL